MIESRIWELKDKLSDFAAKESGKLSSEMVGLSETLAGVLELMEVLVNEIHSVELTAIDAQTRVEQLENVD